MKEFNYVPIFRIGFNEISDGIEIKAPEYCHKNCERNERCRAFYKDIINKIDDIYQCPFGFAASIFTDNDKNKYIFTAMRVEGKYNPKTADPKVKKETGEKKNNRKITSIELKKYQEYYIEYKSGIESYNNLKNFTEDILHDIRKFNAQLLGKSTSLYNKTKGSQKLEKFSNMTQNILAICSFMSLRLNAYDFIYNEASLAATEKSSYNIYKIFDKVRHCLSERTAQRNISIIINCNGQCGDIKAYDCIELLPYIILDNGIKYADKGSQILININDDTKMCRFIISTQSLPLLPGELDKVYDRGFRGEYAKKSQNDGMGIGLYTAKKICDLHNASINIDEVPNPSKNCNYFIIDISINKEYNI